MMLGNLIKANEFLANKFQEENPVQETSDLKQEQMQLGGEINYINPALNKLNYKTGLGAFNSKEEMLQNLSNAKRNLDSNFTPLSDKTNLQGTVLDTRPSDNLLGLEVYSKTPEQINTPSLNNYALNKFARQEVNTNVQKIS